MHQNKTARVTTGFWDLAKDPRVSTGFWGLNGCLEHFVLIYLENTQVT